MDVTTNQTTVEKLIAQAKSFQNLNQINTSFREIDNKLSIIDFLKRTRPRLKLYERLLRIIEKRHLIIHQAKTLDEYSLVEFEKDINAVGLIISKFYEKIRMIYSWQDP